MYRLVLFGLTLLAGIAIILGFFGYAPFGGIELTILLITIIAVCYLTNRLIAFVLKAPINPESSLITGLILFFILFPPSTTVEFGIVVLAGVFAMVSKYIFAIGKRHLFNPVAISLVILTLFGRGEGVWWVGSLSLLPFVTLFGFLVVRKIRKMELFGVFLAVSMGTGFVAGYLDGATTGEIFNSLIVSGPLIFFGTIMLTEPFTTPGTRKYQIVYAALVGFLTTVPYSIGSFSITPEIALVIGNLFSYAVSSKQRLLGSLTEIKEIARGTYEIVFKVNEQPLFIAGQYAECTLPHLTPDSRGSRRYFTIASSPTKNELRFGIRFDKDHASTFKKTLMGLGESGQMVVGSIAGSFILPKDTKQKIVCIAGGIGVTPFRSQVESLLDTNETRDIVLVYANKTEDSIAYRELFDRAHEVGVRTVYLLDQAPPEWKGKQGYITSELLWECIPDIKERIVYISGPPVMVSSTERTLKAMKIKSSQIHTDFFPGY